MKTQTMNIGAVVPSSLQLSLYVLTVWRQDELNRINQTTSGPERKAARGRGSLDSVNWKTQGSSRGRREGGAD